MVKKGHERYSPPASEAIRKRSDVMEAALKILASFSDQEMGMRVEIDFLPEGLDDGHHPRDKLSIDDCQEVFEKGLDGSLAE